ncbi:ATP-dependent helicase [Xylanimonas allomyrinae]|uniref:ATP-dependent helicase n=1 Tax=Xylanimonas allomyrinae TaxID=2509459 RepID=A0A4P6ES03_9MICO|nr:ATP-dependent helicase [Xylanimonas allomyrinae]
MMTVEEQGLPRSSADDGRARLNHVVRLQSLAEDRMGEELGVIWELEVGHSVAPDQGLPELITAEGFDDPNRLAAFVDAVRWGAVTSANEGAFQAPFRSGANVEAYQLEPLRRALQAPRTNLLLADDVGLGKTIEAGLVVQELLLRHRARSVVIVCPPSLALKWKDEMREKFGLDFVIVNSELMAEVRRSHGLNANPFRLFPRVIVSMAWLPGLRAQRLLRDVYSEVDKANSARNYAFDVLVVDEAHHVAPSSPTSIGGARGYAVDSQRTNAVRDLAKVCEHRLFLSATPHNGHSESFTALLEMIDNRRFSRGATVDPVALKEVTVRRLKRDIKEKGFKARELNTITFTPNADEEAAFEKLDSILNASAEANGKRRSGDIVSMLLKKRFLSSPYAFGSTLAGYRDATTGSADKWDDEDAYYAAVLGSDQSDEEEGATEHPEFDALRQSKANDPLVAATSQEIAELVAWGLGYEAKPDSRLRALIDWLTAICRPDGKTWTNERVVIFTEYADTLRWIVENLRQRGFDEKRLATIEGSSPTEERELTRARFSADPSEEPIRVLVATDAAGEGIDLQAHCHRLVNFDVPFNPSRLEQRIGRIDRYGQTRTPQIFQFLPEKAAGSYSADMDFMRRIAEKVTNVADDLGSVNLVIDADIQNHFGRVKVAARAQIVKDEGSAISNRALAGDQDLNRALTQLASTYDDQKLRMHLTPSNARRVVDTALTLTSQPTLIEEGSQDYDVEIFRVPSLARSWDSAVAGLDTRLAPGLHRPITFDDTILDGGFEKVVHVHLGHTFMQKASRILRAALFSAESSVNRVTAVVVDDIDESCVAAISRLVLVGRGGLRLHEEVFVTGVRVKGQRLAEAKAETLLEQTLDAADLHLADERIRTRLAAAWNADNGRLRSRLESEMRKRAASHQESVTADLEKRRDADIGRARQIFGSFRRNLQESLRDRRAKQAEIEGFLFDLDPRQAEQYRMDIRSMENRLENLAAEEAREIQAIKDRYTDIRPFVSAAAVVFALTPQDAAQGELA